MSKIDGIRVHFFDRFQYKHSDDIEISYMRVGAVHEFEGVYIDTKHNLEITISAEALKDLLRLIPSEKVVMKAEAPDHGLKRLE